MPTAPTTRRRARTIGVAVLAVVLTIGSSTLASAVDGDDIDPPVERPNIVVIMTDDQTVESLRVMPKVHELIAREGTTFDQSVVSWSLCCPSRATYLTGQYATNHGVLGNILPWGSYDAFKHQDTTFPVALQAAGYETIHVGKYLNRYGATPPLVAPPGWSRWYGTIDPSTYRYFGFSMLQNGKRVTYGEDDDEYQTDVETDLAVAAIRRQSGSSQPFFLNVAYLAPHTDVPEGRRADDHGRAVPAPRDAGRFSSEPLPRPPSFDEADVSDKPESLRNLPRLSKQARGRLRNAYNAALESLVAVDDGVGRIIGTLQRNGLLDDTYVIFTSDNGYLYGEHRIPSGKVQFYEPSIRVPLLMRGPGIPRGSTRKALVANIDLAPTILDFAHVDALRVMDGISLAPILAAPSPTDGRAILLQSGGPYRPNFGVRTEDYVYIEDSSGERELYDLRRDPDQLDNLAGVAALAPVEMALQQTLASLKKCAGASCDVAPASAGVPRASS